MCGLFINEETHNRSKKLDVLDNDNGEVTVVWMYNKGSQKSLFYMIAGSLDEDVADDWKERTILTYHIINDRLHEYIKDTAKTYPMCLDQKKRKKLLDNGPCYLVTTSLPYLESRPLEKPAVKSEPEESDSDWEYDSDESEDEEWYYKCDGILQPEVCEYFCCYLAPKPLVHVSLSVSILIKLVC